MPPHKFITQAEHAMESDEPPLDKTIVGEKCGTGGGERSQDMYTNKNSSPVASCQEEDKDDILEVWTAPTKMEGMPSRGDFNRRSRTKRVSGKTTGRWPAPRAATRVEHLNRLDGVAPRPLKKPRPIKNMRPISSTNTTVALKKAQNFNLSRATKSSPPDSEVASLGLAKEKEADEDVYIGLRVYAEWKDALWYPGEITAIKKNSRYSLLLYDGDVIECALRKSFITESDYEKYYETELPPPPEEHKQRIMDMKKARALEIKKLRSLSSPLSLQEMLEHRCERCRQCMKDDCGRCASCKLNRILYTQLCIQKMCCHVSTKAKAQPMPPVANFPPGWMFVIDPMMKGQFIEKEPMKLAEGLRILPPNGLYLYYSVEGAKEHRAVALRFVNPMPFYAYIGVMDSHDHEARIVSVYNSRPPKSTLNASRLAVAVSQDVKAQETDDFVQSRELSTERVVGSRVFCKMGEERFWGIIAEMLQIKHKKCRFWVRREDNNSILEDLEDRHVITEARFKIKTKTYPPLPPDGHDHQSEAVATGRRPRKQQRAGSLMRDIRISTIHILIGRRFCLAWTDLDGQTKMLYGIVNECEQNMQSGETIRFKVTYTSASKRILGDSIPKSGKLKFPKSQMLLPLLVLGCCILFEREMQALNETPLQSPFPMQPFYWSWVTPNLRHEELVDSEEDKHLPQLTLQLHGFRLVFSVKPSTIPDAGYGVFLACRPLMEESSNGGIASFRLKAGELIDLGPFHVQDKKLNAVIYIKNFIHSYKCEEWAISGGDTRYQLDLTDDRTGDLHATAMSHIHAYVNETANDAAVTVKTEYDPDGNLHFLLGHSESMQGTFCVPANGREIELFVNYGVAYEKVRVRKGYSFISDIERGAVLELIAHEDACNVKAMDKLGKVDSRSCVKFLFDMFHMKEKSQFMPKVVQRALTCAVVLQRHARLKGGNDKDLKDIRDLVSVLADMLGDEQHGLKELQTAGNFEQLFRTVFELHGFADEELHELSYMMDQSPQVVENLVRTSQFVGRVGCRSLRSNANETSRHL